VTAPAQAAAPGLSEAQRELHAQAFADAVAYRRPQEDSCAGCEDTPGEALCEDHSADWAKADAYIDLATELGLTLEVS
jgi:hypothetical protein